jgi:hypothetical protein
MRVNDCRFRAACTPKALDRLLYQLSFAESQLARPCATARLLIYTHNCLFSSVIGGAGVDTATFAIVGFTVICVIAGYLAVVFVISGGFACIGVCGSGLNGFIFHTAYGGGRSILICARIAASVIGFGLMIVFAGFLVPSFASARATYRSRMESSLSTDSEVDIISM